MAGYMSPEDEEVQRLFFSGSSTSAAPPAYQPDAWSSPQYQQASSSQMIAQPIVGPTQYVSWPMDSYPSLEPLGYSQGQYPPTAALSPSTTSTHGPWGNGPWPALHPDDIETSSETSRSASPNPSDPRNFGILLSDGKSWQCAYDGCTSQARFTRGCDLRKHYRRHTKSIYCRYADCPQSKIGGFSSNKDRQRHEQSHAPAIPCSFAGCDRKFSRNDNMKDHVRRIHRSG